MNSLPHDYFRKYTNPLLKEKFIYIGSWDHPLGSIEKIKKDQTYKKLTNRLPIWMLI